VDENECREEVGVIGFTIFLKAHNTIPKSAEYQETYFKHFGFSYKKLFFYLQEGTDLTVTYRPSLRIGDVLGTGMGLWLYPPHQTGGKHASCGGTGRFFQHPCLTHCLAL